MKLVLELTTYLDPSTSGSKPKRWYKLSCPVRRSSATAATISECFTSFCELILNEAKTEHEKRGAMNMLCLIHEDA